MLGRAGLCFDPILRWHELPLAEAIAGDLPEVRFVLDHLGNPPLGAPELLLWERSIRSRTTHPNTSAKLPGIAGAPRRHRSPRSPAGRRVLTGDTGRSDHRAVAAVIGR